MMKRTKKGGDRVDYSGRGVGIVCGNHEGEVVLGVLPVSLIGRDEDIEYGEVLRVGELDSGHGARVQLGDVLLDADLARSNLLRLSRSVLLHLLPAYPEELQPATTRGRGCGGGRLGKIAFFPLRRNSISIAHTVVLQFFCCFLLLNFLLQFEHFKEDLQYQERAEMTLFARELMG